MKFTRRQTLLSALFGAGYVGLRALATGLPASFLLNPRRALAATPAPSCVAKDKAQYIILATSGNGDPINANVPGTYADGNATAAQALDKISHSDPGATLSLGGQQWKASTAWATLPQSVLDRTAFFHLMTNTPVHPKEPDVLKLMGATYQSEMLPSVLAKQLAPCLGTVQAQPITIGATSPSEGLVYQGQALPIIPPLSLKATLANPAGPLTNLQALRDSTLQQLHDLYKNGASQSQRAYLDSLILSQQQARNINQSLLDALDSIADNTIDSQITAALTLVQMKVTPVVAIHIPFGGDNHHDAGLATEMAQTQSGVEAIGSLMMQLASLGLSDQVTFLSLNVFGRTLGPANVNGRQHNGNHQVSIAIGKPFRSGVIGGVAPVAGDYGALAIDAKSGRGTSGGSIAAVDTLASFGKTALAAVGVDAGTIATTITSGQVIAGALA